MPPPVARGLCRKHTRRAQNYRVVVEVRDSLAEILAAPVTGALLQQLVHVLHRLVLPQLLQYAIQGMYR